MAFEFRQSDLKDPFRDISLLSLLPRTLGVGLQAEVPTSAVDELGSIQNFFKSMELKESRKLLEQAQAINNRHHNSQSFELKEKDVVANGEDVKDHQQGRRPGLGRKRAKFSMEPMPCSLPTVDFSSLDHIDDPEEYFLAYEQLENADKELKKLRGEVATNQTHHQWSTTARICRPGIPGRRSYKERLSKADMIEAFRVTSPDKGIATSSKTQSASALNATLHSETTNQPGTSHIIGVNIESCDAIERGSIAEKEKTVEGSIAKVEKTVEGLLDNLLSAFKDDEGEGEALLRKSLQFKSIDVGKVCLTEWNNTQRNDHKILDNEVLDPSMLSTHTKSPLYAISGYRKSIPVFVPLPWEEEPAHLMSPSDDESDCGGLYRSMSEVKRSISSSANINQDTTSPLAEGAPVMVNGERSQIGDKIPLPLVEDSNIENNITSAEDLTKPYPQEDGTGQNSCVFDIQERDAFAGVDDALEEEVNDRQPDALMFPQSDHEIEDPPSNCLNQNEGFTISPSRVNDKTTSIENDVGVGSFEFETNLENGVNPVAQGEPVSNAEVSYDSSGPTRAVLTVDGHSNQLCNSQVENNEAEGLQENPGQILSGRYKKKAPTNGQNKKETVSKRKDRTRKQSLSGAGLAWKSGVRRSTRIKSRPLEYWRGERFLYGRIHDSLATVIGVKYASPVKGAKFPVLKVKSYVDNKYADLVALASQ